MTEVTETYAEKIERLMKTYDPEQEDELTRDHECIEAYQGA